MEKLSKPKPASTFSRLMERRPVQIAFGLAALVLAYVFVSMAIDSGSLLDYAITLLLLFIGVRELSIAIFKRKS